MFANKLELKPHSNAEMPNTKCIYPKRRISYGFIAIIFLVFNKFDDVTEAAVLPSSLEYEEFDKIPAEMYDLDTKQSQARYDPRTLLKEFLSRMKQTNGNSNTFGGSAKFDTSTTIDDGDLYAEERNSGGAHCTDGNERYEHGEKIQRSDPCEMCLCIDGEMFCWWQKCSGKRQKHTKKRPHPDLRHKWNHLGDESYHEHNRIHSKTSDNSQSQNKYKEQHSTAAVAAGPEEESAAHAYHTKETTSNVLLLQQKHEQQPDKLQQHEQIKNTFPKKSSSSTSASASAFGKHHSLHIMDMNVSEMDSNDKDVNIYGSTSSFYRKIHNIDKSDVDEPPTTAVKSQILTSTIMDAHQQSKNTQHNNFVDTVNTIAIPGNIAPLSSSSQPLSLSNVPIVHADVTNGLLENGVVLNDRVTSIAVIDPNGNDGMLAHRPFNGHKNNSTINIINNTNNNNDSTVNPVILAADDKQFGRQMSHVSDDSIVDTPNIQEYIDDTNGMDKGFYEKTIVNKNGVFIENIRKISGLDQRLFDAIDNADDDTVQQINQKKINFDKIDKMDDRMNAAKSTLASDASDTSAQASFAIDAEHTNNILDEINRKSIDLMNNGAVVQHYVITSSGKIEKTDTLNSDEVPTQMQGVNQYRSSTNSNSNNNNNNFNRPYQLAKTEDEMFTITATITTPKSTLTTANNVAAKTQQTDYFPGGSLLTTINSAVPMSVTTSSLADQSNSNCIVMGKSYKIGTILPQEPGNCLQCLCVNGANEGDAPRVTCSPHNCPPLILPDLFDSTGY